MSLKDHKDEFEDAIHNQHKYCLKLYIIKKNLQSERAIGNLRNICEQHLPNNYTLDIIDICEHPKLARDEQIVAIPTLIKELPIPLRKIIGDLSDEEKVLVGLDISVE